VAAPPARAVQEHPLRVLLHVEARRVGQQDAVQGLRVVVEPAELAGRRLGHPDAGVVELDVGRGLAVVEECEAEEPSGEEGHHADRRG
jgi:hypothetical protein